MLDQGFQLLVAIKGRQAYGLASADNRAGFFRCDVVRIFHLLFPQLCEEKQRAADSPRVVAREIGRTRRRGAEIRASDEGGGPDHVKTRESPAVVETNMRGVASRVNYLTLRFMGITRAASPATMARSRSAQSSNASRFSLA